jgi:hypothetical protein
MQTLMEFRPVSDDEWVFLGFTLVCTVLAFAFLPRVYRHGRVAAVVAALCISWLPVQAIAFIFEDRQMWLPGEHSAIFFWGDSVLLTSIALSFAWMRRLWLREHPEGTGPSTALADRWWWRVVVALVAVGVSVWFHWVQVDTWPADRLHAFSKVWHDFLVYPVFIYYLGTQLPFVWQMSWRKYAWQPALVALAVFGFGGWLWLGQSYDPSQIETQRPLLGFASGPAATAPAVAGATDPVAAAPVGLARGTPADEVGAATAQRTISLT